MTEINRQCVGSGFCCKKVPCPYGERDPATGWCSSLIEWPGDDLEVKRYRCGQYDYISKQPFADVVPAFGGGCCSPLFNRDRENVLVALRKRG